MASRLVYCDMYTKNVPYYGKMIMHNIVNIFLEMSGLSPAYLSVYHSLVCVCVTVTTCPVTLFFLCKLLNVTSQQGGQACYR